MVPGIPYSSRGDVPRGGDDLLVVRNRIAGDGLGVIESARGASQALAQARVTDALREPGVALDGSGLGRGRGLDERTRRTRSIM